MLPPHRGVNGGFILVVTVNHQLMNTTGPYTEEISSGFFNHRFKRRRVNLWRRRCGASFKSRKRSRRMRKKRAMRMTKMRMQKISARGYKHRAVSKRLAVWHQRSHLNMEGT